RTEEIGHPDDRVAVEHQRTEYRRLGFKVVRRHAAAGRRWSRRASQVNRQAEVTISGIRAVTSRWSFTCALPGPIALTGSSNSIFRRSSVIPCCCLSADATSALVTAPNSLPSFPLRSFKVTWAASRRTARALASDSSRCSRWTAVAFCRSTCSCAPRVAGWASLRGIRKFRAKPSATSLVSPALPVPSPVLLHGYNAASCHLDDHPHCEASEGNGVYLSEHRDAERYVDYGMEDPCQAGRDGQLISLRHAENSIETVGEFAMATKLA